MSKATLAIILSKLQLFPKPNISLEQYPTPSEAAATIIWDAYIRGTLQEKHVVDLGAGTGILGIGALLLGARKVTFIDIDATLKEVIEQNITKARAQADITGTYDILTQDAHTTSITADLVLTNPPFGTKEKHADKKFLETAHTIANEVYSFHKTSTNNFLQGWFTRNNKQIIQQFPFTFNLPASMKKHQKKSHHVAITCWHTRKDL